MNRRPDAPGMDPTEAILGNTRTVSLGLRSSRNLLLPGERLQDFQELLSAYIAQLQPGTEAEFLSVTRVVGLRWKLQRADLHENRLLAAEVEKQLEACPEKKAEALLARALKVSQALEEMVPVFRAAGARNSETSLRHGVEALAAMLKPVGVVLGLPTAQLVDLQNTVEDINLHYVEIGPVDELNESTPSDEFNALLSRLAVIVAGLRVALEKLEVTARAAVEKQAETLRFAVRLKVSEVRVIDRYRTALERGIERELVHLRGLREGRQQADVLFGTGQQARLPAVEVKLVQ